MPKGVPHKFDETKQKAFIEAYEALKASCSKDESIRLKQLKYRMVGYEQGMTSLLKQREVEVASISLVL